MPRYSSLSRIKGTLLHQRYLNTVNSLSYCPPTCGLWPWAHYLIGVFMEQLTKQEARTLMEMVHKELRRDVWRRRSQTSKTSPQEPKKGRRSEEHTSEL